MFDRTIFSEEHEIFRKTVARFVEEEMVPYHEQWEEDGIVPQSLWLKAGEAGLLCLTVPEAYGGPGGDRLHSIVVIEEMAKKNITGPGFYLHSDIVASYLINYGTEEQKKQWLPKCVSGEVILSVGMTEPGGGSDLANIKTTAIRDGDEYVINGQKTFISNGHNAGLTVLAVKTDPSLGAKGVSLILVENDRPGFTKGRNLKKVGMKAQDTAELFFDNVRVPASNLLGEEGKGFIILMKQLEWERMIIAAHCTATAEAALDWTIDYTNQRMVFGKPVSDFQNTRFKLAEVKTSLTVGRVFVDRCLDALMKGELDNATASMAKLWGSELLGKVVDECVQLHGGYGFMWEYPIARAYADARVRRIAGGSSEVMKTIIARTMFPKESR